MLSKFTFLLCAILSIISVVVEAAPSHSSPGGVLNTNAKRFRRGLPPIPPSFTKKMKKRGTPVAAAKRHTPSPLPPKTYTGNIKITKPGLFGTEITVGYVKKDLDDGVYTLTTDPAKRLSISFTAAATGSSSQINIRDTSNTRPSTPFLGGAGGSIGTLSANYVPIAGVAQTSPGVSPQAGAHTTSSGSIESAIWAFNPVTKDITAQWINPGSGGNPTEYIVYDPNGGLVITGSPTLYAFGHPGSYVVNLSLE